MSTVLSFLHQDYITKQFMSHSVQVVYNHCGICPVFFTHYMHWTDVSKNINYKQYTGDPWNSIIIYYKKQVTTMSSVLSSFLSRLHNKATPKWLFPSGILSLWNLTGFFNHYMGWNASKNINCMHYTGDPWKCIIIIERSEL